MGAASEAAAGAAGFFVAGFFAPVLGAAFDGDFGAAAVFVFGAIDAGGSGATDKKLRAV